MSFPLNSIVVTASIGVSADTDDYATHISDLGQGGLHTPATLAIRNAIPVKRRTWGMFASVKEDNKVYKLCDTSMGGASNTITDNANWIEFSGGPGTGFVPGSDVGGTKLLVGSGALDGGFNNVAVFGNNTASQDNEFNFQGYSNIIADDFFVNSGLQCGIGSSSGGFFANSFSAVASIQVGGQQAVYVNNSSGLQEYGLGNFHDSGVNPTGAWFNSPEGFAAFSQDSYTFLNHDTTGRITTIGDADGKSGSGTQIYVDDITGIVGTRGDVFDLNTGNTIIDVKLGATTIIKGDVGARSYLFGEYNFGFTDPAWLDISSGIISLVNGGAISFQSYAAPPFGSPLVTIGDLGGYGNSTYLTIDDPNATFEFTQAGYSTRFNPGGYGGLPSFVYGGVQFSLPVDQGVLGDALRSDGAGGTYWSTGGAINWGDISGTLSDQADLQTALNAKPNTTQAAYTLLANNTGSSAAMTAKTYRDEAQFTYIGTITWTGTTAPSGTTAHVARFFRIGSLVHFFIFLNYAVAGSALTQVVVDIPSNAPQPYVPTGLNTALNINQISVNGRLSTASLTTMTTATTMHIRRNAANTASEIVIAAASAAYRFAIIQGTYIAA